jgi:hypothetical protein
MTLSPFAPALRFSNPLSRYNPLAGPGDAAKRALSAARRCNPNGKYHNAEDGTSDPLKKRGSTKTAARIAVSALTDLEPSDQLLNRKLISPMTANIPTQKRQNWPTPPDTCSFSAK